MPRAITLPLAAEEARALEVGEEVLVSGRVVTGRAAALRWLADEDRPALREALQGGLLFHCAPVVERASDAWRVVATAPVRSEQAEPWQAQVIARYGLRGVMGRGGMGPATLAALQEHGAVYLHATGGLAVVLARCVLRVLGVHQLEALGSADALWELLVGDFPSVVTMDAQGKSLHALRADEPATLAQQLMER
jgi:fumarate hydratase class I